MHSFLPSFRFIFLCFPIAFALSGLAQSNYPPKISDARVVTYKSVAQNNLNLWIFTPPKSFESRQKPAIVFFFGGGWRSGTPSQFEQQCKYLASRGMVAMTADYRVSSRHGTHATDCVEDGKSAIRWIRSNADKWGIDPSKIAAGGGSAGGHIAAATATVRGYESKKENLDVSSKPNVLALFNPALALDDIGHEFVIPQDKKKSLAQRIGTNPRKISPFHKLDKNFPPSIIFHGTEDQAVPYLTVKLFERKAKSLNLKCKLVSFPEKPHGFFNWGKFENHPFRKTMLETDLFFQRIGWLKGMPSIDQFVNKLKPQSK